MKGNRTRTVFLAAASILLMATGCSSENNQSQYLDRTKIDSSLEKYFQGYSGSFVLWDKNNNQYTRYNPDQCRKEYLPASTFKILNAMIGLETGVIPNENYVIKWDGTEYQIASWNHDHTLKTAIQNSVVWYFQALAREVGKERMQKYVESSGYGNKDVSGQIDSFWLDGGLRISANEQVDFLRRLMDGNLPFSKATIRTIRELIVLEKDVNFQWSGKTGSVTREKPFVGWFVGYVEANNNVFIFATNIEGEQPDANGGKAQEISRNLLVGLGLFK
jgi:beta-lactamase class D